MVRAEEDNLVCEMKNTGTPNPDLHEREMNFSFIWACYLSLSVRAAKLIT